MLKKYIGKKVRIIVSSKN